MRQGIARETGEWGQIKVIETKGEGFQEVMGGPKHPMLQSDQVRKDVKSVHGFSNEEDTLE